MDFTAGLIALAVGVAFDWQRLFPAIGNRVAALCALGVGQAWFVGGQVGGWLNSAHSTASTAIGSSGHELTRDVPASSGGQIIGIVIGFLFLAWFLAVIPAMGAITKHVSSRAADGLTSLLIWSGMFFSPLIHQVPGHWGDFAEFVVLNGAHIGLLVSGWIL